ncbi:MAG: RNA-binding S4 domain-containing protein [Bacteroidota bacterium]
MIRFDKFIWLTRLSKTRKDAVDAIANGRIRLNGVEVKPSKEIRENDSVLVKRNNAVFTYKVIKIPDRRLGPKLVSEFIEDLTSENEKIKFQEYLNAQREYRHFGNGKPTKKQRRVLQAMKR